MMQLNMKNSVFLEHWLIRQSDFYTWADVLEANDNTSGKVTGTDRTAMRIQLLENDILGGLMGLY